MRTELQTEPRAGLPARSGTELRHCTRCGGERPYEMPPCEDGHGADCPERVCVGCGAALLVDPFQPAAEQDDPVALPHTTNAA